MYSPAELAFKRRQLASLEEAHPADSRAPAVAAAIDRLRSQIDPQPSAAELECVQLRARVAELEAILAARPAE